MAKKAKRMTTAKTTAKKTTKKSAAKKAAPKKAAAAPSNGPLAATAQRVGRTLGRAARGVDKVTATLKKTVLGKRATKKPKIDPEEEAVKARNRAMWKSQAKDAAAVEMAKHGSLVDERARVRATTGMSWSNRKPR
jgi:hypothetical protein